MRSAHRMMFKANRRWLLHVWELTGPPGEWDAQLRDHLAHEPVFAVISGLGGTHWEPIHRFCERTALPCLFPNVELPVVAEDDFYNLYFSRGVLLEADLLAQRLMEEGSGPAHRRLIQVYRGDDVGQQAARALSAGVAGAHLESVERALPPHAALDSALADVGPDDSVILWLRPADLMLLGSIRVPTERVFLSGEMAGLGKAPLPAEWRRVARMAYPYDLPELRRVRMDYPLGWFSIRSIPVVDEQVQSDTYLACGLLAETLSHMSDSFIRDYLVERMEGLLEHRIVTGYYPRLSLAPRQRFASKGGYIVRFAESGSNRVVADSRWLAP
jgi:hypothetical protein